MLSERDRNILDRIDRETVREDPRLAACFTAWAMPPDRVIPRWVIMVTATILCAVMVLGAVLGSPGLFWGTALLGAIGMFCARLLRRRGDPRTPRRPAS